MRRFCRYLVLFILLSNWLNVASAQKIYWSEVNDNFRIRRANLNGTNIEDIVTRLEGWPISMTLDVADGKMYWTQNNPAWGDTNTNGKIRRANLNGTNIEDIVSELGNAWSIALDVTNRKMYWTHWTQISESPDRYRTKIQCASLDGTNIENIVTGLESNYWHSIIALDVVGGKIYWVYDRKFWRANLDGTSIEMIFGWEPYDITIDSVNRKMYLASRGRIQRMNLDGTNIENIVTGLGVPGEIVLDIANRKIYWREYYWKGNDRFVTIRRSSLDGTNVRNIVAGGSELITDIALSIPPLTVNTVSIPDPNLRAAVRKALGLSQNARITRQAMQRLQRLDTHVAHFSGTIRNITGLEHANGLKSLSLAANQISDITPLAHLTNLTWLDLTTNKISNVAPLAGLINLEVLQLNGNSIRDTSPLRTLLKRNPDLELDIYVPQSEPQVINISDENLRAAVRKTLGLGTNTPITKQVMLGLTKLYAKKRQIKNLTGLEHATQLRDLNLKGNIIRNIRPLAGLTKLRRLVLWENQVSDINPLSQLKNLSVLDLDSNRISNIQPLAGLTELKVLYFSDNKVTNITPLTNLTKLEELRLGGNKVTNITPLTNLTKLEILYLADNQIRDIRPLAGLTKLWWLVLWENQVSNISSLSQLKHLSVLGLDSNRISNIQSLAGLTELEELHFQGNKVTDITPLANLTKLEKLSVNNNPIEDMTPLRTLLKRNPNLDLDIDTNQFAIVHIGASQRPPIYWVDTEKGTLHWLTGATVEHLMPYTRQVTSLAVDVASGKLYWTNKRNYQKNDRRGRIWRANLNGTNHLKVKELMHVPHGIAFDVESAKIYLTNSSGQIQRLNFTGSNFQPNLITGLNSPKDIAVDGERGQLYWTEPHSIWRADLDGNNREEFAPNLGELGSIAIAGSKVYTIERPKGEQRWQIRSSTLDGLTPPQTLVTLQSRPMGLAVDTTGGKLYWTDVDGKIQRANFNGGNIQNVVTGLRAPGDLALGIPTSTNPAAPGNTSLVTDQLPAETRLLANYPNPFNPETWIAYQLATGTDVQILIYDARGSIVRRLVLGYQRAGTYIDASQAAYWDGRNTLGERVASGLYFYQLQTDKVSFLRKMLILK